MRGTGRLAGPWIAELPHSLDLARRQAVGGTRSVVLDLMEVSFVDREGIEFLRTLRQLELVDLRCSAFVAEQLNPDTVSGFIRTERSVPL